MLPKMFVFIINRNARDGQSNHQWQQAEPIFREAFADALMLYPESADETQQLARRYANQGCRGVIAVGGEGTMNCVLQGIMQADKPVAMGVVPLGNVNDYTNNLGMRKDWRHALQVLQSGHTRKVGVVELRSDDRHAYALNMADVGFGASTAQRHLNGELTWVKGRMKYNLLALKTLLGWQNIPARLTIDDDILNVDLAILLAGYSPTLGGFEVIPHAWVDDKQMAITIGHDLSKMEILKLLQATKKKSLKASDKVKFYHARHLTIETESPIVAEVDGEIIDPQTCIVELIAHPQHLRFFSP
jgi:YegS/Rv2252/BmrU family lipid kinase